MQSNEMILILLLLILPENKIRVITAVLVFSGQQQDSDVLKIPALLLHSKMEPQSAFYKVSLLFG